MSKVFYERLGLRFEREKHGTGPEHYAAQVEKLVIELYPFKGSGRPDNVRLGFACSDISAMSGILRAADVAVEQALQQADNRLVLIVSDPDGRKIELSQLSGPL